jgi:peptidoglycan/xylan/chitin deacetylase (PgdA/CDA1 family)
MRQRDQGRPGALVISLDFELRWGVHDLYPPDGGAYRENLLGVRTAVPRMLDLFEEYGISATWATVGMLMTESHAEWERFRPAATPRYDDPSLDTYTVQVGDDEATDPMHFAMSLVEQIRARKGQEIGSHTYAHYCALEPGSDSESYRQDLSVAVAVAKARGIELKSLVPPRHQFSPAYAQIVTDAGFTCCRSNAAGWLYKEASGARYFRSDIRAGRLIDHFVPITGDQVFRWDEIPFVGPLCCLPASFFLRAYSPQLRHLDALRFQRIARGIRNAGRTGGVFHLWWHPHNAGAHTDEYLAFLRRLLEVYADCHEKYGMVSMSMADAAATAAQHQSALAA